MGRVYFLRHYGYLFGGIKMEKEEIKEEVKLTKEEGIAIGLALSNAIEMYKGREPEMWQDKSVIKGMKATLKKFGLKNSFDETHKAQRFLVKRDGELIAEYSGAIYNGTTAVEVAKNMHSLDTDNYYSASVEVTFSPVLIEGGSKKPQEIAMWSSDSVSSEDEFNFEDNDKTHILGALDMFGNAPCSKECWCQ